MSFLQSLITRGCGTTEPQASVSSPSEGAMIDFSRGTLLFVIDSTDKISEFRQNIQSEANFNWRIAPLPHTTFNPVNIVQGVNASIPKTDPKQELASWLFIKFFTSPENQAKWVRETNTLPIRAGATEFLSNYFSTSPAAQMTLEMMGSSTHEPSVPGYSQVQALSREALSAILNGADISTELAVLSSDANSILEGQIVLIPEAPDPWIDIDPSGQTVRFWHQQNQPRLAVLEEIISDFNAKNKWGISVVPEVHQSYGVIFQELLPILGTEEVPGLVLAYQHHAAAYHEAGGLMDINSLLLSTKWGLPSRDSEDIYQAIFKQDIFPIFESSRLGFPLQRSTDILYFNADWLEELGYESPPANMEEFIEIACTAARSPGSTEPRMGYHFYVDATRFASWVFAFGGTVFNDAQNLFEFNNPESNSVIQTLQSMFESGCAIPVTDRLTSQTAFSEGSLLFMIDSSYHISTIEDLVSNNAGFDWGVAQMPTLSGSPVQNLFGASLSIPKSSRERELAAWLFILYLVEPQVQAQWGMGAGYLPIRRGAVEFLKTHFEENPNYHASYKLLKYGVTEPSLPGYDFVHQELELALQAIFLPEDIDDEEQEINVLEILNSLNATVNQILLTHLER
jgi:multiple sugar transport system substrate-binding protein/sn-glycerol 3-phosphate transport system substrate-binding protein